MKDKTGSPARVRRAGLPAVGGRRVGLHLDVEHAMPRDHEIVDLAAVAHIVRACDGSHVLLFKGEVALDPGDALLVAGTCARLVARATRCLVVNLPCWHY